MFFFVSTNRRLVPLEAATNSSGPGSSKQSKLMLKYSELVIWQRNKKEMERNKREMKGEMRNLQIKTSILLCRDWKAACASAQDPLD